MSNEFISAFTPDICRDNKQNGFHRSLIYNGYNFQPWRVKISKDGYFHFNLKRNPILKRTIKSADLQRIDMGIAMAHFELIMNELGEKGTWVKNENAPNQTLEEMEYIGSWIKNNPTRV